MSGRSLARSLARTGDTTRRGISDLICKTFQRETPRTDKSALASFVFVLAAVVVIETRPRQQEFLAITGP